MYHHMTTVNTACAPAVRHRLFLIDWVQRTEDMLWAQELPLAIDDCGRQRIGFLLLNRLEAVAGDCRDESTICKVDTFNEEYRLKEVGAVLNWFDITEKEGYFSLNSKMGDILATPLGKVWAAGLFLGLKGKMDSGKKKDPGEKKGGGFTLDLKSVGNYMQLLSGFTVLRMTSMVGMAGIHYTKEDLLKMNRQLNRIKAPRK